MKILIGDGFNLEFIYLYWYYVLLSSYAWQYFILDFIHSNLLKSFIRKICQNLEKKIKQTGGKMDSSISKYLRNLKYRNKIEMKYIKLIFILDTDKMIFFMIHAGLNNLFVIQN